MINTPKYDGGLHLGLLDQKMRTQCLQTLKPWMDIEYGSVSKGIKSFHATNSQFRVKYYTTRSGSVFPSSLQINYPQNKLLIRPTFDKLHKHKLKQKPKHNYTNTQGKLRKLPAGRVGLGGTSPPLDHQWRPMNSHIYNKQLVLEGELGIPMMFFGRRVLDFVIS